MSRFLVAVLGALLVVGVGCENKDKSSSSKSSGAMKASADVCSHCPGVQKANADGKCPGCGAKVSAASSSAGDVCSHCPGIQTASADGKCPACGTSVAIK